MTLVTLQINVVLFVIKDTPPDVGLLFGVPQRSVLGPNNYCMYTKPVGEIVKRHNIKYHCYVDDTQMYMTLKPRDKWDDISSTVEACTYCIYN